MTDSMSGRDLDALRDVVNSTFDEPGPGLPWELMERVRDLFHSEYVEFDRTQPHLRLFVVEQDLGETQEFLDRDVQDPHFWELYRSDDAANYPDRTGDITHVTMLSDFVSDRQLRASPLYVEYCSSAMFRALSVNFPDEPGHASRLMLWRGPGRDFDERDRLVLTLLRPHLIAAYRSAERRRRAPSALTPRQLELLQYVAQGYTNTQIARRMELSEGTVRTHLNHIYERLGVTSRTAAVTTMSTAGLG
ncbi:response regulator transcription factor [Kribbella pittospori]|uniref:Response regulator transcription factor n=1 Tax=Kribbella pittospori TaxID=722689 RepID=A0A4R0KID4_9ACTN|nr:response regulator transcription factor [Kribbella pittospori]TCC57728.1 response regulator transcription factor [Kribbella pittospori]